jgi:hypothetical protein
MRSALGKRHIAAGPCLTWANGKATVNEYWVETGYAPIGHHGESLIQSDVLTPHSDTKATGNAVEWCGMQATEAADADLGKW